MSIVVNQVKERLLFLAPSVQSKLEREACSQDFEVIQGLGQGAFGKVYKVRHKKTKVVYALKQISKKQIKQQKMIGQIINEVKIMYSLDHGNIVKLYNHYEEEEFIYLVLECATGGQLWHKLNKIGRFDEKTVKQYMLEIMSAIEYLHTRNPPIIHRDIKPENILLDSNGHIKIADFGWSNINNHQRKTYCGTLDYLAPEMIMETGHDEKIDYWSLGVLIFELLTGKAPFAPVGVKDAKEQQRQLEENILKVRITFPPDFPVMAKSLIQGLLNKDPIRRFSVQQMREHPWLTDCTVQKDEEEQVIIVPEEHQPPQDLTKNTVEVLNGQILELKKQLNETQLLLKVKEEQKEPVASPIDTRKLKLLEEEKQKLKRDYETLWNDNRDKEAKIMVLNTELTKIPEMQKQIEKLKSDKQLLQEKIRKMNDELDLKDQQILEVQDTSRVMKSQQGSFLNQSMDESSIMDLNTTFTEMKNQFQIAKEQVEEFDKAQRKIIQQQAEILGLQTQLNNFKEQIRQELQDQQEDLIEDLKRQHATEIAEAEQARMLLEQSFSNERNNLKEQIRQLESRDSQSLQQEIEILLKTQTDMKTQLIMDKKLRSQNEQRIREQEIMILDFKEKERSYRKK